jgi:hypothetical protein
MIEVTQATFFKAIGGPENIHPRAEPDQSVWINLATHQQVGKTTPGYKGNNTGVSKRYYLTEAFAAAKNIKEGT